MNRRLKCKVIFERALRQFGRNRYNIGMIYTNKVSKKIIIEAKKKAEEIEKNTRLKAETLGKENEIRLNRIALEYQNKIDGIYLIELNRLKSAAYMEFKKDILREKRKIMEKIHAYLCDYIKNDKKLYANFLKSMALKGTLTGNEKIIVSNNDRPFFTERFVSSINREAEDKLGHKADMSLSEEVMDTGGGLYLKEKRVEFNATVNVVIDTMMEEFEVEIADFLFQ